MNNIGEIKLLRKFLEYLGLDQDEQRTIEAIVETGKATVLGVARASGINRTTTYRILERLKTLNLVEEIIEEHKKVYRPANPHVIEQLVKSREADVRLMRDLFPTVAPIIGAVTESKQPGTEVLFYRGVTGIKQMIWNVLKAKKEVVGYTYRSVWEMTGIDFANDWYREFEERNLIFRDIYSDTYLEARNAKGVTEHGKYFKSRYIPASILNINHQADIYNNVVGLYNWHESEIFGVEIYNENIASFQKQLFEIVWKQGKTQTAVAM